MLLTWATTACEANFILKGDDDVLVNPWQLEIRLSTFSQDEPAIYGQVMGGPGGNEPLRVEGHRYADFKWNKDRNSILKILNFIEHFEKKFKS